METPKTNTINIDYIAPTLSAIIAGLIHHACRENKPLTFNDILLILSPSIPALCQIFIKIISFLINEIIFKLFVIDYDFSKLYNLIPKYKNTNSIGLYEDNITVSYLKYTTNKTPSQKIIEWQKNDYTITILDDEDNLRAFTDIHIYFTKIHNHSCKHFYHEFDLKDAKICIYLNDKIIYIASTNKKYIGLNILQMIKQQLFPTIYVENTSNFKISKIHNKYSDEIMATIKKYKTVSKNVNLNFIFSGKPGTCKTYACRAIAKELSRNLVEIDLTKITYEEEFLQIFKNNDPSNTVFLLDEIDLMCPTREFDDALLKNIEFEKMKTLTDSSSTSSNNSDYDMGDIKISEKLNLIIGLLEWIKLAVMYMIKSEFIYITYNSSLSLLLFEVFPQYNNLSYATTFKSHVSKYKDVIFTDRNDEHISKPVTSSISKTPFTLRTLLNFISGGNTPEGLCICATTNRKDKLDPALIRPGRLRLMEFEYLRKCDVIAMIKDEYPDEKNIEEMMDKLDYTDYKISGALLSSIISSTITVEQLLHVFERELKELN